MTVVRTASEPGEWAQAARVVRRMGFGATGADVDAAVREGLAAHVSRRLAADWTQDPGVRATPAPHLPGGFAHGAGKDASDEEKKAARQRDREQDLELTGWWLRRMLTVRDPFREKATFVWHTHFATSLKKVKNAGLMLQHNDRQRGLALRDFGTLAYTMLTDGATQRWLDNLRNTTKGPNENLSREFMEIFTLGHGDAYTEKDVREGARALTGYTIDRDDGSVRLRAARHDSGSKTVLGRTGDLDAKGFCDAVLAQPGCATYVITRLWNRYASNDAPDAATLSRLAAAYGPRRDLTALSTAMFTDRSFAAADGRFVIGPVEWLLGAMRTLHVTPSSAKELKQLGATLDSLGQLPFYPPSVGGWPGGPVWLSTAAADLRFRAAARIVQQAELPAITGTTTAKLDNLAHLLGIERWSDGTLRVLKGATGDVRTLVTVALNTPEYLVH